MRSTASSVGDVRKAAPFNRRISIRYPSSPCTSTGYAVGDSAFRRARVHNISQGGIGLIVRRPLDPGTTICIRVKHQLLNFSYDLAATVRHTTLVEGEWLAGCVFVRELTMSELAALI